MFQYLLRVLILFVVLISLRNIVAWPIGLVMSCLGNNDAVDDSRRLVSVTARCVALVLCAFALYLLLPFFIPIFASVIRGLFEAVVSLAKLAVSSV
jgi:hypothetical protein